LARERVFAFQHLIPLSPKPAGQMARNFLKEDEEDAAVVSRLGGLCLAADHPGKCRIPGLAGCACFEGVAAG
jgi:hypothetical protein